jgi:hypothetical protein
MKIKTDKYMGYRSLNVPTTANTRSGKHCAACGHKLSAKGNAKSHVVGYGQYKTQYLCAKCAK